MKRIKSRSERGSGSRSEANLGAKERQGGGELGRKPSCSSSPFLGDLDGWGSWVWIVFFCAEIDIDSEGGAWVKNTLQNAKAERDQTRL